MANVENDKRKKKMEKKTDELNQKQGDSLPTMSLPLRVLRNFFPYIFNAFGTFVGSFCLIIFTCSKCVCTVFAQIRLKHQFDASIRLKHINKQRILEQNRLCRNQKSFLIVPCWLFFPSDSATHDVCIFVASVNI